MLEQTLDSRESLSKNFCEFFGLVLYVLETHLLEQDIEVFIDRINQKKIDDLDWLELIKQLESFSHQILNSSLELPNISLNRAGNLILRALSGEVYRVDLKKIDQNLRNIVKGKTVPHARTLGILYWLFFILFDLAHLKSADFKKNEKNYYFLVQKLFYSTVTYRDLIVMNKQVADPRQFLIDFLRKYKQERISSDATEKEQPVHTKLFKVLLVDDDPVMNMMMLSILENEDSQVLLSYKTKDAFEVILKNKRFYGLFKNNIKCIILDFQLPGMDGFEFLEYLRRIESPFHHIPVIVITGSLDYVLLKEKILKNKKYHVLDCLKKPVNKERILTLLSLVSSGKV